MRAIHSFFIYFILSVFLGLLSACSTNNEVNAVSSDKSNKKTSSKTLKPSPKGLKHTHPSNPCTAAIAHSHIHDNEEHKHSYDCENTNEFVSNAHIHPATKGVRKYRHVHPNGAAKHTHLR